MLRRRTCALLLTLSCVKACAGGSGADDAPHQAAGAAGQGEGNVAGEPTDLGAGGSSSGEFGGIGGLAPSSIAGGGDGTSDAGAGAASSVGGQGGATGGDAGGDAGNQNEPRVCRDGSLGDGATCPDFCAAWFPLCSMNPPTATVYPDTAACLATCEAFSEAQLCCRGYHVHNVARDLRHCMHAAGLRTCP